MNREIKFRGKCSHCDAWAYGNLVDYGEGEAPEIHGFDPYREGDDVWREITVDADTVGQFTGLTDRHGEKIFEGDIVKSGRFVYKVAYDNKRIASFFLRRNGDMYRHYFGEAMEPDDCEVIGNIHDNLELLSTK